MIVDNPINYGLVQGQPRIIPTEDDARLIVPASIQPVVSALQPTRNIQGPDNATPQTQSAFRFLQVIQGPSVAGSQNLIMTLEKGLWELEIGMFWQSDFAGTPAVPALVGVNITYQLFVSELLMSYVTIGSQSLSTQKRFLFSANVPINLRMPTTAAAQNIVGSAVVNAIRVL